MILAVEIISIIFMSLFIFTGIWGFVIVIKMHNQLKYRNYILEKLSQNIYLIASKINNVESDVSFPDESASLIKDELDHVSSNISKFKK